MNLIELGHLAAWFAFALAMVQALAPVVSRLTGRPGEAAVLSRGAAQAVFVFTTIGGLLLLHAFVTSNFSVQNVAMNSNSRLPLFYKITAMWGSHEGSLYLWVWVLSFYTLLVTRYGAKHYPDRLPVILSVQGWLTVGFFGLILFLSNPFLRLLPSPAEGRDLNPLLQDPGMVIHPPMLYLGYVGLSVPFAFAMTALLTRWKSELWVGHIRRFALIAWGFLTTGILLGGWWSYYELGWGGYWAWDPVENASFMPWLAATALVHSITVQERRRMLHAWNLFLAVTAFALSLLGTFLVRSGVLSSVHAFAVDPGRGTYILVFMGVTLGTAFAVFLARVRYQEAEESIVSYLSRESLFVWNNVLFTVAAGCVLLGTLYPLAVETFTGGKLTVGAPYFNFVMVPLFLLLMFLMAAGPVVPWRRMDVTRFVERMKWPSALAMTAGSLMVVFAWPVHWTGPVAVGLVVFSSVAILSDFGRHAAVRKRQFPGEAGTARLLRTFSNNRRLWGGMVVHLGVAVMAIGLTGSGLFRLEKSVNLAPGDEMVIGANRLRFEGTEVFEKDNYQALQARLRLVGTDVVLTPERRRYPMQEMPTTESSIHSTPLRDLYTVIGETDGTRYAVHVYINPLVQFIWLGGLVMIAGLFITMRGDASGRRAHVSAPA